jgi:hypothetical protein
MTNRVPLNNVDHHDLGVVRLYSAAYGDAVNQAVVFPTEFEEAQRDYPILFRRDTDGNWISVVLLGLDADENLFLDEHGWHGRHVPAIHQRGPFSLGVPRPEEDDGTADPIVHIDLDDPRVDGTRGERLFRPHGGNTPYFEHVTAVLRAIHVGHHVRLPLATALEAEGLIQPVAMRLEVDDSLVYDLPDFHAVPREALDALDGPALERLNRDGFLRAATAASLSLANIGHLLDLKRRRRAAVSV